MIKKNRHSKYKLHLKTTFKPWKDSLNKFTVPCCKLWFKIGQNLEAVRCHGKICILWFSSHKMTIKEYSIDNILPSFTAHLLVAHENCVNIYHILCWGFVCVCLCIWAHEKIIKKISILCLSVLFFLWLKMYETQGIASSTKTPILSFLLLLYNII